MTRIAVMQLESLKATTDTKEVSFKIAYGLPLSEMLRWGLYISGMGGLSKPPCLRIACKIYEARQAVCSPW